METPPEVAGEQCRADVATLPALHLLSLVVFPEHGGLSRVLFSEMSCIGMYERRPGANCYIRIEIRQKPLDLLD